MNRAWVCWCVPCVLYVCVHECSLCSTNKDEQGGKKRKEALVIGAPATFGQQAQASQNSWKKFQNKKR